MINLYRRKTSPKVIGGLVQKKNNHIKTARLGYVVDRYRPGKGYRHVLKKKDIHDFIDLVPDWDTHSVGIESIILDIGNHDYDGLYTHYPREDTGIIWLSAWTKAPWIDCVDSYFREHKWHFDLLGVVYERNKDSWRCHFSESQARGYLLLHIFLHELGHHVDKLRSRNKNVMRGGEAFAERFANDTCEGIWPGYVDKFGWP